MAYLELANAPVTWSLQKCARMRSCASFTTSVGASRRENSGDLNSLEQSWTALISRCAKSGHARQALRIYEEMRDRGVKPSSYTFVAALKACSALKDLERAKQLHAELVECGLESVIYVENTLVDVYAKCGSLVDARFVFEEMPQRDIVSWNTMILGYAHVGEGEMALHLYTSMQDAGILPNDRTYVAALKACRSLAASEEASKSARTCVKERCLKKVRVIHSDVVKSRCESAVRVGTMLVDVYGKCGSLVDARLVFERMPHRDVFCWTAMILGYAQVEEGEEALHLYARMRQEEGVVPNDRTFVSALKACSSLAAREGGKGAHQMLVKKWCLEQVRAIHSHLLLQIGADFDIFVGTMLVDAYAKCGSLVDARHVFEKMPHRDVVLWNSMILGYADREEGEQALQMYARMQQEGLVPTDRTFVSALKACGTIAVLEKGKEIHAHIRKARLETDPYVASSLIDMYSKCGCIGDAQQVFRSLPTRDVVTWSAMIAGHASQGESGLVFDLFQKMREEGVQPDGITFLSLLNACSHVGRLDKGQEYFEAMSSDFGITPTIDHYICMVDLLGRAGQLEQAMEMAKTLQPNAVVWKTVLSACQKWCNVELGRQAFEFVVRLDTS